MKITYYAETDPLSIQLRSGTSDRTEDISPDITLDFDAAGNLLSLDLESASQNVDLKTVEQVGLLLQRFAAA
jgi:uncharacterized protein YuzE